MLRFLFCMLFFALFSTMGFSQNILVFDKRGKVKRIRYFEGEYISLKSPQLGKVSGMISYIGDSTIVVNENEIHIGAVTKVYNTQTRDGLRLVAAIFAFPAIGYLPLVTVNGLINNDSPVIKQNQLYYSSGFIGVALLSTFIANRPFKISEKRPLKVIDISM